MNLTLNNHLSFKAILPKTKLQVQNKKTGEYVPAAFYEIDCKDRFDCLEFKKLPSSWWYGESLCNSVFGNYHSAMKNDYRMRHYEIKTDDNEVLAICRTWQVDKKTCDIEYLESKPHSDYRFAGQAILASIAKEELNRGCEKLTISSAISSAYPFYERTCQFRCEDECLEMNRQELEYFIQRTEERTKSKLNKVI